MLINNPGHIAKMAAMLIYIMVKTFNNLLQNWWTNFNESWHVASGPKVLQCVYKS